jgi:hypothetical protein
MRKAATLAVTAMESSYHHHIGALMLTDVCPKSAQDQLANMAGLPIKRGDGSVGRCGSAAPICVCVCVA